MSTGANNVVRASTIMFTIVIASPTAGQLAYNNDFETSAGSEWSSTTTSQTPGTSEHAADNYLGDFLSPSSGQEQCVTLSLGGLPPHSTLLISFDLYLTGSWDGKQGSGFGPDEWRFEVDSQSQLHTTFSILDDSLAPGPFRQDYPDAITTGDYAAYTGSHEQNTLGFPSYGDAVFRFPNDDHAFVVEHSAETAELTFCGTSRGTGLDDTWGLDNVQVRLTGVVPSASAWGLTVLALGILTCGGIAIRKQLGPAWS